MFRSSDRLCLQVVPTVMVTAYSAASDSAGAAVFLAKSAWEIGYVADKFPNIKFAKTCERHDVNA